MAGLDRALAERREISAWPDLLAVRVDLALQVNDLDSARQWVSELTQLAQDRSMPYLRALAARAEGGLCLALGDAQGSLPRLRAAVGGVAGGRRAVRGGAHAGPGRGGVPEAGR